jgi:hypothetical protein
MKLFVKDGKLRKWLRWSINLIVLAGIASIWSMSIYSYNTIDYIADLVFRSVFTRISLVLIVFVNFIDWKEG